MRSWRGSTRAGVALATLVVAAATGGASAAASGFASIGATADAVAVREVARSPAQVRDYWTRARMRAAEPAALEFTSAARPGLRRATGGGRVASRARAVDAGGDNTAFPTRAHGRVFFSIEGGSDPGDYVCSGTVVDAPAHTVVWTAGHCVNDAEFGGGFATNWSFVPGYRHGQRPFGTWAARELYTTRGWRQNTNIRVDLGAAQVARDGQGRGIEDVVGGLDLAFDQSRDQLFNAFGYPMLPTLFNPEFDGERLYSCTSPRTADDNPPGSGPAPMRIDCDMTGGASGGAWIASGRIHSVTSYSYAGDFTHLYGPYLGNVAEDLYADAGGQAVTCAGKPVTNLGGPGAQNYAGTAGADSFKLGGGRDRADGGRGRDKLCGGRGRDVLIGGPGRDVCIGGPGRDRARGCEVTRKIP
ncbi:MAG: trypsin-like serine peptidase [Solirubrobacterales bacterium]